MEVWKDYENNAVSIKVRRKSFECSCTGAAFSLEGVLEYLCRLSTFPYLYRRK